MRQNCLVVFLCVCSALLFAQNSGSNRVLKLEELTYTDIDKLDRQKSVFILTFGNLEEHGPHLPVGTDYFEAIAVRDGVVKQLLRSHPDYTFVLFPVIPLGEGGANDNLLDFDHIGTYAVTYDTLRNIAVDVGSSIARKGFRHIFVIHDHGAPLHNAAFNEAAAFVSEKRGCCMVNLTSVVLAQELAFFSKKTYRKNLGDEWKRKVGFDQHAGTGETAMILAIRPDLVKPQYKTLPPFVVADVDEFFRTSERKRDWRGYWGAPALASGQMGRDFLTDLVDRTTRIAEIALTTENPAGLPVYPDAMGKSPESASRMMKAVTERYAKDAAELESWLKERQRQ